MVKRRDQKESIKWGDGHVEFNKEKRGKGEVQELLQSKGIFILIYSICISYGSHNEVRLRHIQCFFFPLTIHSDGGIRIGYHAWHCPPTPSRNHPTQIKQANLTFIIISTLIDMQFLPKLTSKYHILLYVGLPKTKSKKNHQLNMHPL